MDFTLRLATPADIATLQEIEIDAGRRFTDIGFHSIASDDPLPSETLRRHINDGAAWIAEETASGPIGYAIASELDGEAHLDQVSVRLAASGRGVGRHLVLAVCAWAVGRGYTAVTLTTFRDVAFNGPLYARLLFEELPDSSWGPGLRRVRANERALGIDVSPRIAMRRDLLQNPPEALPY